MLVLCVLAASPLSPNVLNDFVKNYSGKIKPSSSPKFQLITVLYDILITLDLHQDYYLMSYDFNSVLSFNLCLERWFL